MSTRVMGNVLIIPRALHSSISFLLKPVILPLSSLKSKINFEFSYV